MAKIFIDVGHGGADSGAVSGNLIEKNMNLVTALSANEFLKKHGVETKMSREKDMYLSLTERANMANNWKADYFISCHYNAGGGDRGETIHSIHGGAGKILAGKIAEMLKCIGQTTVKEYSKASSNYVNQDYFTVIASANMPAIIVEPCFIDNAVDRQIADTIEKQKIIGVAIAKGILNMLGISWQNDEPIFKSSVDDLMNELMWRGIISDRQLWTDRGNKDLDLRYLYDKYYWYIIKNGGSGKPKLPTFEEAINIYVRCGLMNSPDTWRNKSEKDTNLQWFIIKTASYIN